jgi:hypothetical protein
MDRSKLDTATQLLAKAESTTAPAEAIALVERSYRLLADLINAYAAETGETDFGPRRRERRWLRDRRGDARRRRVTPSASPADAASGYRSVTSVTDQSEGHHLDLKM